MIKETRANKIKRLIFKCENIRNICTSAHIHHGKCITGSSRIPLSDGTIKTAKEIFEIAEKGKVHESNEDYTIFIPDKPINIFSLNKKTGKIEKKPIQYVWRLRGGETIKINLRNGFEIETTPEHKYIVLENGSLIEKEAKDIKLKDRIVCARKLNVVSSLSLKKEILYKLAEKNFYVRLKKEFNQLLKKKILEYGIEKVKKDFGINIKTKFFYRGVWLLRDLIRLAKLFWPDIEHIYNNIDFIFYRTDKQRDGNSNEIKLPNNFKEFFYLAGLFIGDGSFRKFIVKEELGKKFIEICNHLDIKPILVKKEGKTPELHTNLTLIHVLNSLFDYPLKQKSQNVRISNFLLCSPNEYIAEFLKAYFDCNGSVEESRGVVTISSTSKRMINDLHLLLLRFGCVAIQEKDNALSISGISAVNFEKKICFGLEDKKEKLKTLTKKVCSGTVYDKICIGNQMMFLAKKLEDFLKQELAYIEVKSIERGFEDVVYDFTVPETHNFVAEGMIIHNTAMTDNLLAAAGMMAAKYAGDLEKGMLTWQHEDEQTRFLTVDAANVSMIHEFEGNEYLINLIDTPGHVDFSGNVTRAMRAVDGTIVLVCAVEGIMPQTETVIKQALRERVKPTLFINKFDRLIKELKLSPEKMQERIVRIINEFNKLIEKYAEPEYKQKWKVSISDGSVAFGSARDNWALSLPFMQKKNVTFKDIAQIYSMTSEERNEWVWKNAPLYEVILDMVIKHHPNPVEAQAYRIPKIWRGDLESEFGKDLLKCNPKGKVAFIITRVIVDPITGKEISIGRLFSGTLRSGVEVYLNNAQTRQKIQQVLFYDGIKTEVLEEVPAGNVLAISGISGNASETVTLEPETPFEEITHIFEPVVTQAIEAKKPEDLPKLINVLKQVAKEDPSIKIQINEETGQHLLSGMGELHLEIITNRIRTEKNVEVNTSQPIVVYRETVTKASGEFEGRSPNKHNIFYMKVEPLEDSVYNAIKAGEIRQMKIKKKDEALFKKLEFLGVERDEIKQYREIYRDSVFLDKTRGIVAIGEVIELVMTAFEQICEQGVLAKEPCMKLKVSLMDCKLHEDAIHRGPAQVIPAVRDALKAAIMDARPVLFEPIQLLKFESPISFMSQVSNVVQSKRGQIVNVEQEEEQVNIEVKMPVNEMFGLSNDLRSATEGRATFFVVDQSFEQIPRELQEKIVRQIRDRKGLALGQ